MTHEKAFIFYKSVKYSNFLFTKNRSDFVANPSPIGSYLCKKGVA